MSDMLVKLYDIKTEGELFDKLMKEGITIKRALAPDMMQIVDYVRNNHGEVWASECMVAFANKPISCYVAVKDKKLIGFSCYETTAKGFFGPMGVDDDLQGKGIGKALLHQCLSSMWESGYAYAVIGGAGDDVFGFYKKTVGAVEIPGSEPGVYKRMIED
jgi:GNAT superfamily N-acetyltransferase